MLSKQEFIQIPKIEFHRHLDGSIRFETLVDLIQHNKIPMNFSGEDLFKKAKVLSPMKDLQTVLDSFWISQKALCNYEAIRRVSFENVEDAFYDGIKLIELRFATTFIAQGKNLKYDEIIEGVIDGISDGMKKYPIQVGLIHILPRSLSEKDNIEAHKTILKYQKSNHRDADRIVGFDLADSENENDQSYLDQIIEAKKSNLGITIHSGENTNHTCVMNSIKNLHAERIGHGLKIWNHQDAIKLVKERNVHLELCPTSNWLTNSVTSLKDHPFNSLYKSGVSVSLNSDDPHLMGIDLINEYKVIHDLFHWDLRDFYEMNKKALDHSFLNQEIKEFIKKNYFSN
jgi:adenosine deaminase